MISTPSDPKPVTPEARPVRAASAPAPLSPPLTKAEIQTACDRANLPIILNLQQAADLICLKPSTLKKKVSLGHFDDCALRGKPLRFWTDRLLSRVMNQR